jgi:hypothetical protein
MARALNQRDQRLLDQIKQAFKANAQFALDLAGGAAEDVDKIRSLGRRAGRELVGRSERSLGAPLIATTTRYWPNCYKPDTGDPHERGVGTTNAAP